MKKFLAVFAVAVALPSLALADCNFYDEEGKGGNKFQLSPGQCAVLEGDSTAGCDGLPATFIEGWNDRIQSVGLVFNTFAILKQNPDGSGESLEVQGQDGMDSLGALSQNASVAICR